MTSSAKRWAVLAGGLVALAFAQEALYLDVTGFVSSLVEEETSRIAALILAGVLAGRWLERAVRHRDLKRSAR
jgi:hypothetical protein